MRERNSTVYAGLILLGILVFTFSPYLAHAQYQDNLNDVYTLPYSMMKYNPMNVAASKRPVPIGDLGRIETVIDLRDFVPMSLISKSGRWRVTLVDTLNWYKVPTKKALLMLYYGDLDITDIAEDTSSLETRFSDTAFLSESGLKGENARWAGVAYNLASKSGTLFETIAGSGFQSAEPTTIFLTPHSAFIMISFKYESALVSHGQVLVALEFSRASKKYKTFYNVYSTQVMTKSTSAAAVAIAPYVAKAAAAYFGANN